MHTNTKSSNKQQKEFTAYVINKELISIIQKELMIHKKNTSTSKEKMLDNKKFTSEEI